MKKTLIALAMVAAMPMAFAQSSSGSTSSSSANPSNANAQYIQLNTLTPEHQTVDQNVNYSGTQKVKNVPGIAMSGPASGPCTGMSGGVGVAGPGFGVGLNGSKVDDGCTVRENTRVLGQLFQALDSADPMKAQARDALARSMLILDAMNDKIGGDYVKASKADTQPAKVTVAPPVAAKPVAVSSAAPAGCTYTGSDEFIRGRVCGK